MKYTLLFVFSSLVVSAQSQQAKEFLGNFGYSESWYHTYQLTLKDSAKFFVRTWSDVGSSQSSGTWKRDGNKILLFVLEEKHLRPDGSLIKSVINSKQELDVLIIQSTDELFFTKSNGGHVHLKRNHHIKIEESFKIRFPKNIFQPNQSQDSLILKQLAQQEAKKNEWLRIILRPFYSQEEASKDKYIGLKRCKEIIDFLINHNKSLDENDFVIKDLDFTDDLSESEVRIDLLITTY